MKKPFEFIFSLEWKLPYICVLANDDKLLETRAYAVELLSDMQTKSNALNVYVKGFNYESKKIAESVYLLNIIIIQCDNRLNPKIEKDSVAYTGTLAQEGWK